MVDSYRDGPSCTETCSVLTSSFDSGSALSSFFLCSGCCLIFHFWCLWTAAEEDGNRIALEHNFLTASSSAGMPTADWRSACWCPSSWSNHHLTSCSMSCSACTDPASFFSNLVAEIPRSHGYKIKIDQKWKLLLTQTLASTSWFVAMKPTASTYPWLRCCAWSHFLLRPDCWCFISWRCTSDLSFWVLRCPLFPIWSFVSHFFQINWYPCF